MGQDFLTFRLGKETGQRVDLPPQRHVLNVAKTSLLLGAILHWYPIPLPIRVLVPVDHVVAPFPERFQLFRCERIEEAEVVVAVVAVVVAHL